MKKKKKTEEEDWKASVNDVIAVLEALTDKEAEALGNIYVGLGKDTPADIVKTLIDKKLIVPLPNQADYDAASYWVHCCWCVWCARKEPKNADNRPEQDKERS